MPDVIGAAGDAALGPHIDDIDPHGVMDAEVRMQRVRRAHARNRTPPTRTSRDGAGRAQRQGEAVDRDRVALGIEAARADLDALHRRIDVARRAVLRGLFAEHVPRLDRVAELDRSAADIERADQRTAQLDERAIRFGGQRGAVALEMGEHVLEVAPHEVRQQEAIVQLGAPSHERMAIRRRGERRDERAHEHDLRRDHPRMRRHLERAQLDEALATVRRVRIEQLVDRDLRAMGRAGDIDEQVTQ